METGGVLSEEGDLRDISETVTTNSGVRITGAAEHGMLLAWAGPEANGASGGCVSPTENDFGVSVVLACWVVARWKLLERGLQLLPPGTVLLFVVRACGVGGDVRQVGPLSVAR